MQDTGRQITFLIAVGLRAAHEATLAGAKTQPARSYLRRSGSAWVTFLRQIKASIPD